MQKNKRYFYTDPLAAAWMWDKFRMKFVDSKGQKFVVHSDSLYLLECRPHDLASILVDGGKHFSGNRFLVYCYDGYFSKCNYSYLDDVEDILLTKEYKVEQIVQRDGIAFMWPESEDAQSK